MNATLLPRRSAAPARPDPADRRLVRWLDPTVSLPPFDPPELDPANPAPTEAYAIAAAAACPDVFLIDAPPGPGRTALAGKITAISAVADRVFVLAPPTVVDGLVAAIADAAPGVLVGRALGAGESPDRLPSPAAERTARSLVERESAAVSHRLVAAMTDAEARASEAAAVETAASEFRRITEAVAKIEVESHALRTGPASDSPEPDVDADPEVVAARAELDAAIEEAKKSHGFVGFVRGLWSKGEPIPDRVAELQHKLTAVEETVRFAHAARQRADVLARLVELATERARMTADATELSQKLGKNGRPDPMADFAAERVRATDDLAVARAAVAEFDAHRVVLAGRVLGRVRVVVGPPAAVGTDPLLSGDVAFDRVVVLDADSLGDAEFLAAARLAPAWVLLGDARPNPFRAGAGKTGAFARLWARFHRSAWVAEGARFVVRLAAVPGRDRLRAEPLADRPAVELRFLPSDDGVTLAEVAFSPGISAAASREFLAVELGEVRLAPVGPARWHDADGRLFACWPAAERAGVVGWADLEAGVREKVIGAGADAVTAAVTFDPAAGWTRATAEEWLDRHTPNPRFARAVSLPRTAAG
ncbi:MAG: hypothetical protein ACRC7O_19405 [Fimbriiglobus sp.]